MQGDQTRRKFIQSLGISGFSCWVFGSFLVGCKKKPSQNTNQGSGQAAECPRPEPPLAASELEIRSALKYVDVSPYQGRTCDNCKLYQALGTDPNCGGCSLFRGPVRAKGHCVSWIQRM